MYLKRDVHWNKLMTVTLVTSAVGNRVVKALQWIHEVWALYREVITHCSILILVLLLLSNLLYSSTRLFEFSVTYGRLSREATPLPVTGYCLKHVIILSSLMYSKRGHVTNGIRVVTVCSSTTCQGKTTTDNVHYSYFTITMTGSRNENRNWTVSSTRVEQKTTT